MNSWISESLNMDGPVDGIITEQTNHLPTDQVEQYWRELMNNYGSFLSDNRSPSFMQMLIPGGKGLHASDILNALFH